MMQWGHTCYGLIQRWVAEMLVCVRPEWQVGRRSLRCRNVHCLIEPRAALSMN